MQNKGETKTTASMPNTESTIKINDRTVLNTNTDLKQNLEENISSTTTPPAVDINMSIPDTSLNKEDVVGQDIRKKLSNWELTRDENKLREALALTSKTNNEVVLSSWVDFMKKNSSELIKILSKSTDINKTKTDIYQIFDWFITMSGEYDALSTSKKQEIKTQYQKLK
jgi:hypothetical protein